MILLSSEQRTRLLGLRFQDLLAVLLDFAEGEPELSTGENLGSIKIFWMGEVGTGAWNTGALTAAGGVNRNGGLATKGNGTVPE